MYGDTRCTCSASERPIEGIDAREAVALLPRGRTIAFDELVRLHALSTSHGFHRPARLPHRITIVCIRVPIQGVPFNRRCHRGL